MTRGSDKGPFVARGAKRSRGVKVDARAEVLKILSAQLAINVPEELLITAEKVYLAADGPGSLAALVGGMIRGGFSPGVTNSLARTLAFVHSMQVRAARG